MGQRLYKRRGWREGVRGRGMRSGGEVIGSGNHMAAFLVMRGNIYIW